jgi:5-(carboxyamino)imidazole ribonucleotide mutase
MTSSNLAPSLVGIIMGSDSDLPTMQSAIAVCEDFGVPHEVAIVSAHRTPERMVTYAKTAHERGLKVIIAGAGGAAHLPGMVAALTPLPVIGVPVKSSALSGVDSLYSIVQMPGGIPVATVAIGNAQNAGLLAIQMLAIAQPNLLAQIRAYRQSLETQVLTKQNHLEEIGYRQYVGELAARAHV